MTSRRRVQIQLQPEVLRWARERGGFNQDELASKVGVKRGRLEHWEQSGEISFTQTEKVARATHTPLGYLFLSEPPEESLPIPDFRTRSNEPPRHPSPDLLETVYSMQQRQSWMRDELVAAGAEPLDFVGGLDHLGQPSTVAHEMLRTLSLDTGWAAEHTTWTAAVSHLIRQSDAAGVMIVSNGVVGNNTHRKLDPQEFQGFALLDEYAPLIFVNNADFKTAQMFTLAHELAHIFVGEEGVSVFDQLQPLEHAVEQACNKIAAEFLLPEDDLRAFWPEATRAYDPYQQLARHFKVSTIVAARRALDVSLIDQPSFAIFYRGYVEQERITAESKSGGNFWNNQNARVGYRFGAAVVRAVKEGRLPYREAYALTGLTRTAFNTFATRVGL